MKVLLARHAAAIDREPDGTDEERWLTEAGRAAARAAGAALRAAGHVPRVVVASPLVRAVQTAELMAAELGYRGAVEIASALAPDGSIGRAAALLEARGELVLAVGHEPSISALAGALAGRALGAFRKGQVVLVEDGQLSWRYAP
jgi:phosphohistidine phosphatase